MDAASVFGFVGNFLSGYMPYKLWKVVSSEKPDLRSLKKVAFFMGIAVLTCVVCGVIIAGGLYLLGFTPFMPTAAIIALTNALWAIIVGSIVLELTYNAVSKRKLLYTDILKKPQHQPVVETKREC